MYFYLLLDDGRNGTTETCRRNIIINAIESSDVCLCGLIVKSLKGICGRGLIF